MMPRTGLGGQERSHDPAHAVAEDEDAVGVDVTARFEHFEGLAIAVELGVEVDVAGGTAFAVPTAGFVDAQGHKTTACEVIDDDFVRAERTDGLSIEARPIP